MDSSNPGWCERSGGAAEPGTTGAAPLATEVSVQTPAARAAARTRAVRWDQLETALDDGVHAEPRAPNPDARRGKQVSLSLAQQAQLD